MQPIQSKSRIIIKFLYNIQIKGYLFYLKPSDDFAFEKSLSPKDSPTIIPTE